MMYKRQNRLTWAIEDYMESRKTQDVAPLTLKSNLKDLNRVVAELGNLRLDDITPAHMDKLFKGASKTRSPISLTGLQSTLTNFFLWCKQAGLMDHSVYPLANRRPFKVMPTKNVYVRMEKFPALLNAVDHPRDRAVIALGLYLMLRQSEIVTLRIADLDLDNGLISVEIPKTKDRDIMPICSELDVELRAWMLWYTQAMGPLNPEWLLVPARWDTGYPNGSRKPLRPERPIFEMHKIVQQALEGVGVALRDENGKSNRIGVHTLRRSGARALFDANADAGFDGAARQVQAMLHHSSMVMTERYLGITIDRERRNSRLLGKPMFPALAEVTELDAYREERE